MICHLKKIEKENLTNDLIQQDIINGFKNDSHITTNVILIIVGIFFAFCFAFLTPYAWLFLLIPAWLFMIWYIKRTHKIKKIKITSSVLSLTNCFTKDKVNCEQRLHSIREDGFRICNF